MSGISIRQLEPNPSIPSIHPGDTVKVSVKLKEGDRERIQPFQGIILRMSKGGSAASFTVRRSVSGIGVERSFLLHSPLIDKVEVIERGHVRRAKLYYLRNLSRRATRAKLKAKTRVEESRKE